MNNIIVKDDKKEYTRLILDNGIIKTTIIPELGGNIFELIQKATGSNYIHQPEIDLCEIKRPKYGDKFLPPYDFGFDDCFPTISPSQYRLNGKNIYFPDHGELWTRAWEYNVQDDGINLQIYGINLNYRFKKKIMLDKNILNIHYSLLNLESLPFQYIWSSHPLLIIDPDDEILVEDEIEHLFVNWASDDRYGKYGDIVRWPCKVLSGNNIDLSKVQSKDLTMAIKFFSDKLKKGCAGLYRRKLDTSIIFNFDERIIPYLGIWLCYGGWPKNNDNPAYTIALEPTSGRPDSLSDGIKRNEASSIMPEEEKTWSLSVSIIDGKHSV